MNQTQISEGARSMSRRLEASHPVQAAMLQKNLRRYTATLDFLERNLSAKFSGRVLDYGCGFPFFVSWLREHHFDAVGYEPYAGPEHQEVARALGVEQVYVTTLSTDEQFDVITLVDVIEHLSILRPTMTDLLAHLRPGGWLVASTPNGLRLSQWLAFVRRKTAHPTSIEKFLETDNNYTHHQREFTRRELEKTMRHYGLEVISSICVDTTPARADLEKYHQLLGRGPAGAAWRARLRDFLQHCLPADWQNNLLILARKPAATSPTR